MRSPDDLGPVRAEFDEPQLRSDVANTSRNGDSEAARFSATTGGALNNAARMVIAQKSQKSQKLRDATHLAEQKKTGEEMAPLKGIAECPIAAPSHVERAPRVLCDDDAVGSNDAWRMLGDAVLLNHHVRRRRRRSC